MKLFSIYLSLVMGLYFSCWVDAQSVATALLREGEPLPGDTLGNSITSIRNTENNGKGGYAFTVITDASFHHIWGRVDSDTMPTVLYSEGEIGDFLVTTYEAFFGLSDSGDVFYGVSAIDTVSGDVGLDGVVLNNTYVQNEGNPIDSIPGAVSTFNSRPGITADGQPYWVGGVAESLGGPTDNRVLFLGEDATPVIRGGQNVAGVAEPLLVGNAVDFDVRFSDCGSKYLMSGLLDAPIDSDAIVVTNGAAILLDGVIIREGNPIPLSVGGIGDNYDNFDFLGISEFGGKFMITGDTDAATDQDEFVMVDGQIVLREGETIDGFSLAGSIEGAFLTDDGNWGCIWDVNTPTGNVESLIVNGELLLKEGDAVDWNGDGKINAADEGAIIESFSGIVSLTASRSRTDGSFDLFFTADVTIGGEEIEGGFTMTLQGVDVLIGDVNCDGAVTLLDVAPFVKLITSGVYSAAADVNEDGCVDLLDVQLFVDTLTGG